MKESENSDVEKMTLKKAQRIISRPVTWDYSDFGDKVQKAFEKLTIKHGGYMTGEEEKEFVKHLVEFLELEEIDFVSKICTVRQVCQFPLQCYEVIYGVEEADMKDKTIITLEKKPVYIDGVLHYERTLKENGLILHCDKITPRDIEKYDTKINIFDSWVSYYKDKILSKYEQIETSNSITMFGSGNVVTPVATLKNGYNQMCQIINDDHCYVVCLKQEDGTYKPTTHVFEEVFEVLKKLEKPK